MLDRQRLLQYAGISLIGALISWLFTYLANQRGLETTPTPSQPRSLEVVDLFAIVESGFRRFWKIWAGLWVIFLMEIMQELGQYGLRFSPKRVLRLESFRMALRRMVRGQGWSPEPQAGGECPASPETAAEREQSEAVAAAEYANQRATLRHAEVALRRLRVDHLVYGVRGPLADAMSAFEEATGVAPCIGGAHPSLGTHNALVALGEGAYFEILSRDPEQPDPPRVWMGLGCLIEDGSQQAAMLTWAVDRASGLSQAVSEARASGYDPGTPESFARQRPDGSILRWCLAYRHYTREMMGPGQGIVPFLIDWQGCATPAAVAPRGCELVGLRAEATDVDAVARSLRALGISPSDLQLRKGPVDRLVATLRTPKGLVEF